MPLLSCALIAVQEVHAFYHAAHKCTLHDLNIDSTFLNASIPKKKSGWTVTIDSNLKVRIAIYSDVYIKCLFMTSFGLFSDIEKDN